MVDQREPFKAQGRLIKFLGSAWMREAVRQIHCFNTLEHSFSQDAKQLARFSLKQKKVEIEGYTCLSLILAYFG